MSHLTESPVIILVGPKHAGKTSVGRALAALLGVSFTDLDECVETLSGKSPRSLYKEGADVFRRFEAEALGVLLDGADRNDDGVSADRKSGLVIAAGGGLIDNRDVLALLNSGGDGFSDTRPGPFLVYLEVSAATAWARIEQSAARTGELPPFLSGDLSSARPQETHRLLHERRAAAYREIAALTVQGEGKTPEELGREIFRACADNGKTRKP
ncbi:shikimate kinase [Spirochaetia bacterium]|nr:shikimate kinase [Spirochaetia bacterium]